MVPATYMDFRRTERARAVLVRSRAVRESTKTYWKLSGIIIRVNVWMPHTEKSMYSGTEVNSSTKTREGNGK